LHALAFGFIDGVGGPELLMIMFVVLLLFGGEKLPQFARGFGKAMREFKKATSNVEEEIKRALEEEPPAAKPAVATLPQPAILPPVPSAPLSPPSSHPAPTSPPAAPPPTGS